MDFTEIPEDFEAQFHDKFIKKSAFAMWWCREDPTKFAYYMLGKTPYLYQDFFFQTILEGKKEGRKKYAMCTARQLGKSIMMGMFALWAAWFNKFPSGIDQATKIFIISRTDDQAKELLLKIRELIRDGDRHLAALTRKTGKHTKSWFSNELTEPNNTQQISFKNGSFIKSIPPSDIILGKSADVLIIDEAHHLRNPDPDDFYYRSAEPTIAATNGIVILSSTPKGASGFYYKCFDPDDKFDSDFQRLRYHYSISTNEQYLDFVEDKKKAAMKNGELDKWRQEFETAFNASSESFFDMEKIDGGIDSSLNTGECEEECILGVDYGMTNSHTTFVVAKLNEKTNGIEIVYAKRFPLGFDTNNVLPQIEELRERYNIVKMVLDDCPEGYTINQHLLNKGENVFLFNFTREKQKYYCAFRRKLNHGELTILKNEYLTAEMHELVQEESKTGRLMIHKPSGGTDDLIDAAVMAASHFLEEPDEGYDLVLV